MAALDWEMNFLTENRLSRASAPPPPGLPSFTALTLPCCPHQTDPYVFLHAVGSLGHRPSRSRPGTGPGNGQVNVSWMD